MLETYNPCDKLKIDNTKKLIYQCCVCRRYKIYGDKYVKCTPAFEHVIKELCNISHIYCPDCYKVELEKIEVLKDAESAARAYPTIEDTL